MNRWTTSVAGLLAAALLLVAMAQAQAVASHGVDTPVSICAIRADPQAYLGKVVTVSADYATDRMVYEYLQDAACASKNILDIGFEVPERDASVDAFKKAITAECRRRGMRGLCVLHGSITLRGEIASTKGAHLQPDLVYLIINPHRVLTYSFSD